jgi:hypothetical protein
MPINAITLALNILTAIEQLAAGVPRLLQIIQDGRTTLKAAQDQGRDITKAEFWAVNAQIDEVLADLNKD